MAAGIGETLRATRRQQRLSLAEAAAEIRVREPYLAALEEEKFNKLGGDVYVRAFLRGYSEYLGLDPDQVVEAYRREFEGGEERPRAVGATASAPAASPPAVRPASPPPPPPASAQPPPRTTPPPSSPRWDDDDDLLDDEEPRSGMLSRALIGAGVVLLLLVVALVFVRGNSPRSEVASGATPAPSTAEVIPTPAVASEVPSTAPSVAAVPEQPSVAPSETAAAVPPPSAPPTAAPPPASTAPLTAINVELTVTDGPSWLRATRDGTVVNVDTFQPGTVLSWTANETLLLRIGDCSNVRLVLNGVDQGLTCADRELREIEYRIGQPA